MIEAPIRALAYMTIGVTGEVLFTAVKYNLILKRDWKLQGFTQVWTMPLYALGGVYLFEKIHLAIIDLNIICRFVIYALVIYVIEYIASFLIEKIIHKKPWDYSAKMCNLNGRVTCYHFPFWGFVGILFEVIHNYLIAL